MNAFDGPFAVPSRRNFFRISAGAAAVALRIMTEPMLAGAADRTFPDGAVMINLNENPLGPSDAAREALSAIIPKGGRYSVPLTQELTQTFSAMEGLKPEYVRPFPGSSDPLHFTVLAFTSPTRSYVTADPGYEAGMNAAKFVGARIVTVPLTKTYAHDVKAMIEAAPDAGVFYICNPNNPTGSMTSHSDIEYALAKKPKGSILMIDEAYLHFSDGASVLDLVKADQDVILLRTFSKIYGMAGLRGGFAIARPDLLAKIEGFSGTRYMPITAAVAATASLKDLDFVPKRKKINADIRDSVFEWLDSRGFVHTPSQANFFMIETKRPAKDVIDAMAQQNVFIGRIWPIMPTWVRVSVGTRPEMDAFQEAFARVMSAS